MSSTRVLIVLVQGESKFHVDRAANLILDELKTTATFIEATMDCLGEQAAGATGDDPPVATPMITITIRNGLAGQAIPFPPRKESAG